jgi:ubiquitin-conjugating enzyme E2 A
MGDFRKLRSENPTGISGAPQQENIMLWEAVIFGYDDGVLISV